MAEPTDRGATHGVSAGLSIDLLGEPAIHHPDGRILRPRGNKAWGLLAYLLLASHPPRRTTLAELLFSDAVDPLGALRWNLAELRRTLGPSVLLDGDPVRVTLPSGCRVDTVELAHGAPGSALEEIAARGELLRDIEVPASPAFDIWLLTERRRLAGAAAAVLREAVQARLAVGDAHGAVDRARRLVEQDPLDESSQELLVRALVASGDTEAARRQRNDAVELIRRELGVEPGEALREAATAPPVRAPGSAGSVRATAAARLEAGEAAMAAGASDVAIRALRDALPAAQLAGDRGLLARVLAALGAALVHGVRGHDGEAARHLHEAASLAGASGDLDTVARAERELGYVEMLRGRYDRAERWLTDAADAGAGSAVESAWSRAVRAAALSDVGLHDRAIAELADVLVLARDRRLTQVEAWALTFLGRAQLLQGERGAAVESLTAATAAAEAANWTSFVPLPQALFADALLAEGAIDAAEAAYERAHALALQLDDPCWEGIAGRGLGLVAAERGDLDAAFTRLTDARRRCVRVPDAWLWVEAYCLDALAGLAVTADPAHAEVWIADLETLAARTGMREFVTRAYLHRARLGDESAKQAVAVLAAEIENPSLTGA